jgi:hypothetical protein
VLRQAVLCGLALSALVLLLGSLDDGHALRLHSTSYYIVAIAVLFAAVGVWVGHRLTRPHVRPNLSSTSPQLPRSASVRAR